jgi:hypothetical protein
MSSSFPLLFPCPCFKDPDKVPPWCHATCGFTIYLYLDGDLGCKHCPRKSFIQNWLFGCIHDNDDKAEGHWIPYTDIGMLFHAMGKAAAALTKAGAPATELAKLAATIGERWDHTRVVEK